MRYDQQHTSLREWDAYLGGSLPTWLFLFSISSSPSTDMSSTILRTCTVSYVSWPRYAIPSTWWQEKRQKNEPCRRSTLLKPNRYRSTQSTCPGYLRTDSMGVFNPGFQRGRLRPASSKCKYIHSDQAIAETQHPWQYYKVFIKTVELSYSGKSRYVICKQVKYSR